MNVHNNLCIAQIVGSSLKLLPINMHKPEFQEMKKKKKNKWTHCGAALSDDSFQILRL